MRDSRSQTFSAVVVYLLQRQLADVGVHRGDGSDVAFDAALVLVLLDELGRSFSKRPDALLAEFLYFTLLRQPVSEQRLSLGEVTRPGALAEAPSLDDLVDVPDSTSHEESRRSSRGQRHRHVPIQLQAR